LNNHTHEHEKTNNFSKPLVGALLITLVFTVIEIAGGYLTGSLALFSDAGHMFTDTLALILSLGALKVGLRPATEEQTFGFIRAEILAALINGATLIIISLIIFYEAIQRLFNPPEISAPLMLGVAIAGLGANAIGVVLLHKQSKASLNVRGAFLHMFGDMISSVGVIIAALLILFFGLVIADPVISIVIGLIILIGAWRLVKQSTSILLESVPSHLKLQDVMKSMLEITGVKDIHDLHVWTLSSGLYALSAHIVVEDKKVSDCSQITTNCESMLKEKFHITHTTLQIECTSCDSNNCVFHNQK
jgi:cobalt-zinc-cadmium efflux system protein